MKPPRLSTRRSIIVLLLAAGLFSYFMLDVKLSDLSPGPGGRALAGRFFSAAFQPDFSAPVRSTLLSAMVETVRIAAAAVSLSIAGGFILGFLGSTAWRRDDAGASQRILAPILYGITRFIITGLRSVHELLWATIFLAAFGMTPLAAVIALSLPFTGTFAKIFSEMIDEADPGPSRNLRAIGASPLQLYFIGLIPLAFAELISYMLYRFECGLRSSAVMGFMGITTLGYYLMLAFEDHQFNQVWAYLYALLFLIITFEKWSSSIRQRLQHGVNA
jgi:phosphonate transport system permease protein